ncbi:RNA polymerase sigma factor [Adhaeribacter aquaticus]|uniref:RNA polymerase sigma factor n=1 Tax=Adhaeribacter aquaticus TaxID=299567 RepID=UPI0003FF8DE8|nr:RNA polymerase sigma factor [Adhaeribacter aquaticus]
MPEPSPEINKQAVFLQLYQPVHDRFERYCQAQTSNNVDAKDLVSETILIAYEKFDSLRNTDAFLSFLFGVASRLIKNKSKKNKFWGIFKEKKSERIKDQTLNAEAATDINILYQALNQLPENHKEAIILFEISGFSLKEIQGIQQISLSSVKSRLVRGRTKLAQILKDHETDIYNSKIPLRGISNQPMPSQNLPLTTVS